MIAISHHTKSTFSLLEGHWIFCHPHYPHRMYLIWCFSCSWFWTWKRTHDPAHLSSAQSSTRRCICHKKLNFVNNLIKLKADIWDTESNAKHVRLRPLKSPQSNTCEKIWAHLTQEGLGNYFRGTSKYWPWTLCEVAAPSPPVEEVMPILLDCPMQLPPGNPPLVVPPFLEPVPVADQVRAMERGKLGDDCQWGLSSKSDCM